MRILIIEDEKDIACFLQKNLNCECYVTDVALDGETGLNLASENNYNLIIMDYLLPKKNGYEICQSLRNKKIHIPILMISVLIDTELKTKLLNAGVDDYLTKPFAYAELLARVRALLRRPVAIKNEILTIDDLSLNSKNHCVVRKNTEIFLTRKEFMLLELLLQNPGLVISRGMIFDHVWDTNADPFSNTIESHVVSLRKKIDICNSKKLIHTVSGRGYKIHCRE